MSTTYTLYEDDLLEITTTEMSSRYDLSINFKGKGEYPQVYMELFNDVNLSADQLAEIGYQVLYAAFLQMDNVEAFKERISKL